MSMPVGGRGKKAPYETSVLRVPTPLVRQIQSMIDDYRSSVIDGQAFEGDKFLEVLDKSKTINYEQALEEARKILKSKKSSAESLAKLLQVLYLTPTDKADLKS